MYIKSVIIDGFKSYGRRTEIHGFDREFTAITGLNGTGKSNILDSICFVLGIMNLGQVRAASLQDLVYKSGQAGVTKATVTLIFDNTDVGQCPLGYEKCREISVTRQIVVGGKNKYLINGKLVQNKKVADLFCSVQLNVNNPNFLIMQGRITKVLNMKPHEILSMIEEAAGTSMYETKREATTKLIEKKDAKVRETDTLLHEEVEPKLEKLRQERAAYIDYQKICRDIEYLTRIYISYRYLKYKEATGSIDANIVKLKARIETCGTTLKNNEAESERIDENYNKLQQRIDQESSGEIKKIEKELSARLAMEAKTSGNLQATQDTIKQEEKKLHAAENNITDDEETLQQKEAKMREMQDLFTNLKEAAERDTAAVEQAQRKYEATSQGLTTDEEGNCSSLQDQLINAKKHLSETTTTIKTSEMELRHCRKILSQKENETQTSDAAYIKDKALHDQLSADVKKLQENLESINYTENTLETLQEKKRAILIELRQLRQKLDGHHAYRFDLQYRDPEPNFDRSQVIGMIGKLFDVLDEQYCLPLMITAGGSLYSYVANNDTTCKKILQNGQLPQRVTFIPLNKIISNPVKQDTIDFAQNLASKENVKAALSLINYESFLDPAMKFVFGHTLICRDLNVAKQVTYHRNIQCRTVTLDGDSVDPEGTLTGGSRPKGSEILQELAVIRQLEETTNSRKMELSKVEQELKLIEGTAQHYKQAKHRLELRSHEMNACQQRLEKTSFQQHQDEIKSLKDQINTLESTIAEAQKAKVVVEKKIKDIEFKMTDAKGHRERELKAALEAMKDAKAKSQESQKEWKKYEQQYETMNLEIEELQKGIRIAKEQYQALSEKIVDSKNALAKLTESNASITQEVRDLKQQLKSQKEIINAHNKDLKHMCVQKDKLQKQNQELAIEIKKKENELTKISNDRKQSDKKIVDLESKYSWITEDSEYFGRKNTRYDYSKEDPVAAGQKLTTMRDQKEKMERNINMRAMMLLEREEEQYQETMRRKKIVEQDKEKIKNIICKMDEKKREKVEKAWKVVDENFSSIFGSLLPGAQSRLKPIMQSSQLIGLEINVGFNGVWKDSLGELSGGQRSLVALSLVLAMLKFSPAPLYILDEVDAALDMSHTQNIGNMLKAHFTSSQFIIVSLKDGMFNNANVLFRTKFEEGVSVVTRTVNSKTLNRGRK